MTNLISLPRNGVHAAAALLLLAVVPGCALDKTIGNAAKAGAAGAVAGARGQLGNDSTRVVLDGLLDAATAGVGRGVKRDIAPAIDKSSRRLFTNGETFIGHAQDSVAFAIRGQFSRSLQDLIAANGAALRGQIRPTLDGAGDGLRAQLAATLDSASTGARSRFLPLVGEAVDTISDRFAVNMDRRLGPALTRLIDSVGTTTRKQGNAFVRELLMALGGAAVVVVALALLWMNADRKRKAQALLAMARAVRSIPDEAAREDVKNRVKASARRDGVDGYLHTFLEKQQLLTPAGDIETAPPAIPFTAIIPPAGTAVENNDAP